MSGGADLLRLLEPAVRPVAQPTSVKPAGNAPFESQSFDDLLNEARFSADDWASLDGESADATSLPDETVTSTAKPSPLSALADVSHIENPSLRAMLAQAKNTEL